MKKVDYKGRVIKRQLSKCKEVCRSYSEMQDDYARFLQVDDNVREFQPESVKLKNQISSKVSLQAKNKAKSSHSIAIQ